MKNYLYIIIIFLCQIIFNSCKIGSFFNDIGSVSKDAKKISADFGTMRATIVPIDSFTMGATAGVLTELSSADSEEKLDSIAARISRIVAQYLNTAFQTLDPGPIGNKLVTGALDTLLAAETQQRIKFLIDGVSKKAGQDISLLISNSFSDLSSPANKEKLNSILLTLFDAKNSDSLAFFINRSINQIDFEELGAGISKDIFQSNLRPEIDSIARTAVRAIFDEIRKDNTAKGFFGDIKHILFLGLGLLGVIIGLFFWWNRRKSVQMNKVFMNAIENLDKSIASDVKKSVEKEARQQGVLKDVDEMLKKEGLLNRDK